MATANSGFNEDKKRASPGKDFLHRGETDHTLEEA
jgi:hypothetical protein